jgi:hypothetical protein
MEKSLGELVGDDLLLWLISECWIDGPMDLYEPIIMSSLFLKEKYTVQRRHPPTRKLTP